MVKLKFKVNNDTWSATIHEEDSYIKKHGDGSAAITIISKKEVHFNLEEFSWATTAHEMFHVYSSYQLIFSAELNSDQAEEIFAEMFGIHARDMIKLSNRIYKYFKKNEANI